MTILAVHGLSYSLYSIIDKLVVFLLLTINKKYFIYIKFRKENYGDDDKSLNFQRQMMKDLSMQAAFKARLRTSDNEDNSTEESSSEEESKRKIGKKGKRKKKATKMNKAAYKVSLSVAEKQYISSSISL